MHRDTLSLLWSWSAPQRTRLVVFGLLGASVSAASVSTSLLLKALVDSAIERQLSLFGFYALILAGTITAICIMDYLRARMAESIRIQLLNRTQSQILHSLLQKEYASIANFHSGELSSRFFSDVSIAINGIMTVVPNLLLLLVQFVGAGILLYRYAPPLVLLLLAASMGTGILMLLLRSTSKRLHKERQRTSGQVQASVQETLQNLQIVKAMGISNQRELLVANAQDKHQDAVIRHSRFAALTGFGMSAFFQISGLTTLVWGGFQIMQGQLSYGTLSALIQLSGQLQAPLSSISEIFRTLFSSLASAERIEELLALPDEEATAIPFDSAEMSKNGKVVAQDLCFSYAESKAEVLRQLTFAFPCGTIVAITGESGVGKSTLFALLLGLYEPTSGTISLWIREKQYRLCAGTRSLFSYIPQENGLFSGTLRNNLTQFNPDADDAKIWAALETACLADHIRSLPNGLNTLLGEHGSGFSEGQRQRIAIARALLSNAPILLLDEATSALDESTEKQLLQNISQISNRTCLIVTHRKAALKICSQVIHLS